MHNSDRLASFGPREKERLLSQWKSASATLMDRDGTDPRFENGGHRIKQNPLLTAAIEEIRDGYLELFNTKSKLQARKRNGDSSADIAEAIQDVDYDLIVWNKQSYERLQRPHYGLANDAYVLAMDESAAGLSNKDAAKIVGSIIKRSINAFEVAFARDKAGRPDVPHVPLVAVPEQVGRRRNAPLPRAGLWSESATADAGQIGASIP